MNRYQKAISKLIKTDMECGIAKRLGCSRQYTKKRHLKQIRMRNWTTQDILIFKNHMKMDYFQIRLDRDFIRRGLM